jgi:hypothetical protein
MEGGGEMGGNENGDGRGMRRRTEETIAGLTGGCGVRRGCGARHKLCLNEGGLFAYVKASFLQVKSFCNSTGMCVAFFIVCQLIRGAFRTD